MKKEQSRGAAEKQREQRRELLFSLLSLGSSAALSEMLLQFPADT
jgi:hypothetical protein